MKNDNNNKFGETTNRLTWKDASSLTVRQIKRRFFCLLIVEKHCTMN